MLTRNPNDSDRFTILSNTAPAGLRKRSTSASHDLEARLIQSLRGTVRFDIGSRSRYSTDASNYRQVPIGVAVPLDAADVKAAIAVCREFGAPVLSRGGGTSLAGQCCNAAVILDCSQHLKNILKLDPASKTMLVRSGTVLDRVREAAERHQSTFAPDPATHSRCTIGGMIGNNSCGVHALMGRKTISSRCTCCSMTVPRWKSAPLRKRISRLSSIEVGGAGKCMPDSAASGINIQTNSTAVRLELKQNELVGVICL